VVSQLIEFPPEVDASDPIWQINIRTLFDVRQEILRGPAAPLLYWRVYDRAGRKIIDRRSVSVSLGDRRSDLVPAAIPATDNTFRREIFS
jgi:hypothetical protein